MPKIRLHWKRQQNPDACRTSNDLKCGSLHHNHWSQMLSSFSFFGSSPKFHHSSKSLTHTSKKKKKLWINFLLTNMHFYSLFLISLCSDSLKYSTQQAYEWSFVQQCDYAVKNINKTKHRCKIQTTKIG